VTCRPDLPFGDEKGDFELENGGPIRRIVALGKATEVVHPPLGRRSCGDCCRSCR
jgi:hypothetical protein